MDRESEQQQQEQQQKSPPGTFRAEGYAKLGNYIGQNPQHAIFCSFRDLYAENLLYLQAEVVYLSDELKRVQDKDNATTGDDDETDVRSSYFRDWRLLRASAEGESSEQLNAIIKLKEALDKYYDSLFRYNKILKMDQPKKRSMNEMTEWMERPLLGNIHIKSEDEGLYIPAGDKKRKPTHHEMVCLDESTNNRDPLTVWIIRWLVRPYHEIIGRWIHKYESSGPFENTMHYSESKIVKAVGMLALALGCAMPAMSIYILYVVQETTVRIGIILGLSVLFALCLASMTLATPQEIFSSTATFAAVLVVFIGTDGGSSN